MTASALTNSNHFPKNSLQLRYSIKYNTTQAVPLDEVITSLNSLNFLLKNASQVLTDLTHVDFIGQAIYVEKIETGSLKNDIILVITCQDAEALKRVLEWMDKYKMTKYLIPGLIGAGLMFAYQTLTNPNTNAAVVNHTTTITDSIIISGSSEIAPEMQKKIDEAIERKITRDKNGAAKAALEFFSPVRTEPNASISLGDGESVTNTIEPATIVAIPTKYEPKKNNRFESLQKVKIELRATDIDKRKQGWAGTIAGVAESRITIVLDPTLEPNVLHGKTSFVADIDLERTYRKTENQMIPTKIIVRKIY